MPFDYEEYATNGRRLYTVLMLRDGRTLDIYSNKLLREEQDIFTSTDISIRGFDAKDQQSFKFYIHNGLKPDDSILRITGAFNSEEHAIKAANEYRALFLSLNIFNPDRFKIATALPEWRNLHKETDLKLYDTNP